MGQAIGVSQNAWNEEFLVGLNSLEGLPTIEKIIIAQDVRDHPELFRFLSEEVSVRLHATPPPSPGKSSNVRPTFAKTIPTPSPSPRRSIPISRCPFHVVRQCAQAVEPAMKTFRQELLWCSSSSHFKAFR